MEVSEFQDRRLRRSKRGEEKKKHAKGQRVKDGRFLELPELIINDILSRLPFCTIFKCRCVCKTFNKILKDPYFAAVHLTKASNINRCLFIQDRDKTSNSLFVDTIDLHEKLSSPSPQNNGFCPWKTLTMPASISQEFQPRHVWDGTLVGSCNGLICICYVLLKKASDMFCVCNPILGEFMVLPESCFKGMHWSSFGFCPKTKKYKVIRFMPSLFTEIHTLGTECWRKINHVPPPRGLNCMDCSSFNGNFPFLTHKSYSYYHEVSPSHLICSFNFETEQYMYIPPPNHFFENYHHRRMDFVDLGMLGGLLSINYVIAPSTLFEVWVMKKYGVKESWTKQFTIDMMLDNMSMRGPDLLFSSLNLNDFRLIHLIRFIKVLNNGDLVIDYYKFRLIYYSPQKRTFSDILNLSEEGNMDITEADYSVFEFRPSFISLKDIGGGASVEYIQRSNVAQPLN